MNLQIASSIFLTCIMFFSSNSLAAKAYTPSLKTIADLAVSTVKKQIDLPKGAQLLANAQGLNKFFHLPSCQSPLKAKISNNQIKALTTVKVSCQQADKAVWQSFVLVKVSIKYQVAVASRILNKGQIINKDDLVMQAIDERRLRGAMFDQSEKLIGTRLKRRIGKGNVIYQQNVCYVCRGDTVSIYAKSKHFQIKTIGTALSDGNPNEKIRVRNLKSNKIIEVNVVGVGEVEVKM